MRLSPTLVSSRIPIRTCSHPSVLVKRPRCTVPELAQPEAPTICIVAWSNLHLAGRGLMCAILDLCLMDSGSR